VIHFYQLDLLTFYFLMFEKKEQKSSIKMNKMM